MSLKKKTLLGLFVGLGGLGWVAGIGLAIHAANLAQENRVVSSALTASIVDRANLVHQLEELTAQQRADAAQMTKLQDRLASSE